MPRHGDRSHAATAQTTAGLLRAARDLPLRRPIASHLAAAEDLASFMHVEGFRRGKLLPPPGTLASILGISHATTMWALFDLEKTGFVVCRGYEWLARGSLPALSAAHTPAHLPGSFDTLYYRRTLLLGSLEAAFARADRDADALLALKAAPLPDADCVQPLQRGGIESDLLFDAAVVSLAGSPLLTRRMHELLHVQFRHPVLQIIRRYALTIPDWRVFVAERRSDIIDAVVCGDVAAARAATSRYATVFIDSFFRPVGSTEEG